MPSPPKISSARAQTRSDRGGIELPAAAFAREGPCGVDPSDAMCDLHELRQLRDPRGDRDVLALQLARPPAPVPPLVGPAQRVEHLAGQPELRAQRPRQPGVLVDHVIHFAVARERELEPHPEPVQRWVAGSHQPQRGRGGPQAACVVVVVLPRLQGDVVAEPLGLLMGVGMAAHVDQQRRVVHDRPLARVEPCPLGQAQRDQALAQDMLHGLPEAEVDSERERRDELRQPDVRAIRPAHSPGSPSRLCSSDSKLSVQDSVACSSCPEVL